ncbi:iron-sulfur cluster assembly scaffold protein [Halomonas daqiaonensis]|uniref:NifU-like N terminal domain-containing protein n=1 Tax=Halomonas daqiaonensis TaxID=650850 RepID=A0A1H7TKB8_9GAMM|nr:iron-sulfur cluster assembly scaffold protein [Halomonas daqiaonensis]SEL84297.1 NifU-like N terminal domain-containing protein [Halomonas daqiaonensis]
MTRPEALTRTLRLPDCLERGLRTRRAPPLPHLGEWVEMPQGLRARFSVAIRDDALADVRFEATPCATLVAYCQALAEHETERPLHATPGLDAKGLANLLHGVPPIRQGRAILAVAALRAALKMTTKEPSP